jgi:hypothetical protein
MIGEIPWERPTERPVSKHKRTMACLTRTDQEFSNPVEKVGFQRPSLYHIYQSKINNLAPTWPHRLANFVAKRSIDFQAFSAGNGPPTTLFVSGDISDME